MQVISSKDNEIIKKIKKLNEKKYRDEENKYLIEGIKIVEEAIKEKANIEYIVVSEEAVKNRKIPSELLEEIKDKCIYTTEKIFKTLTQVINPQGIIAVVNKNEKNQIKYDEDILVVLDGIQDPGNLGTILRTVDSIGLKQLIVSKETADAYNPKVVRSTMGAIFRINIIEKQNLEDAIKEMKNNNYKLVVTSLQTENSMYDIDYSKKIIVIGNEANGVSKQIQDLADEKIKIPMLGKTESLNASVATGIVLYEYVRQKIKKY